MLHSRSAAAALLTVLAALPATAQTGQSLVQLAKNPFADLTNLQFFFDANLGISPGDQSSQVVTLQPVIPFSVSPDWSIITRTVLPPIDHPGAAPGEGRTQGVGDTQFSSFLSPTRTGSLVWAVGPVFQLPTATNDALGQGKWGVGPTAGVQWSGTQWTFGALINNTWSFAGTAGRPAVNQMQLQPEVNYTFKDNPNRYLSYSPTITANWEARALDGAGFSGHRPAVHARAPIRQPAGDGLLQRGRAGRRRQLDARAAGAAAVSEMRPREMRPRE